MIHDHRCGLTCSHLMNVKLQSSRSPAAPALRTDGCRLPANRQRPRQAGGTTDGGR